MTAEQRRAYKRQWNADNKVKRAFYQARLYAENPDYREKALRRSREQYQRKKEQKLKEGEKKNEETGNEVLPAQP